MMTKTKKNYKKIMLLTVALMTSMVTFAQTKIGGIYYKLDAESKQAIVVSSGITERYTGAIVIPSTVKSGNITYDVISIGASAFEVSTITSIKIPASIKSIGAEPFRFCTTLASITVDSQNTIYDSRNGCNAIIHTATNELIVGCMNTVIPNTITRIADGAFTGVVNLTHIDIPNSVTSIGTNAFFGCTGLKSIKIPDSVTSISKMAFHSCGNLEKIELPSNLQKIGDYSFRSCYALASMELPNTVTTIGAYAFQGMSNLFQITIPASVTRIDNGAFSDCPIGRINFESTTPPDMASDLFNKNHVIEVHVPEGCKKAYENNPNFENCTIIDDVKVKGSSSSSGNPSSGNSSSGTPSTGIKNINSVATSTADKIYSVTGQRLSKPVNGMNIINGKKYILK